MTTIAAMTTSVGIDVAKCKLDVVLRLGERALHQVFANTPEGFQALDAWLQTFELTPSHVRVCLEATGSYSDAITQELFARGYLLCVLNPALLVDYRRSQNTRSKTDKLDAHLLARYAQEREPRPFTPLPAPILTLRALLHHRDDVQQMLRQERNRLEAGRMTETIAQRVRSHTSILQDDFKLTEREIKAHLKAHPDLKTTWQRLQTIPGIGWLSAAHLLAHLGEIARFQKVGSVVSLAGLAVKDHQSGSSVRGRPQIDRQGRSDLRQAMYMCALVARRCSPEMQAWAKRLADQHKAKKVVLVAVMRKLLHIVYGVWKSGQDFAAQTAEVIFTAQPTLAEARAFYRGLKGRLARYGRTPDQLKIMPGIFPVIGQTEREAREKYDQLQALIHPSVGLSLLSNLVGEVDLSSYPLDGPLPELPETNLQKSRLKLVQDWAAREKLTIRQLYEAIAGARGHRTIWGTPVQIADQLEEWFVNDAADGFNIMPPYLPGGLDEFVEQVIPILQHRELFRTAYEGQTLRENLGLSRPATQFSSVPSPVAL